mgnify:CR=1 FL=1
MAIIPANFGNTPVSDEERHRQRMAAMLINGGTGQNRGAFEAFGNMLQAGVGQALQNRQRQANAFPAAPGASPMEQVGQNLRNAFGGNRPGKVTPW